MDEEKEILPSPSEDTDDPVDIKIIEEVEGAEITEVAEDKESKDDFISFKRSHLYSVLLPVAFVVGLSVGYLFWGRGAEVRVVPAAQTNTQSQQPASQAQSQAQDATQQVTRYNVPIDDDPILGPSDADITLIEFSDYECPYCQKWHEEVYFRLLDEYEGQIRIVYRDFPLNSIHPNAEPAAIAANCAGEQDAYWEYHDKLFSSELPLGDSAYQQYASDLDLDLEAFNQCLESDHQKDEIQADFEYASNLGVRSTPTFFINGIPLVGAQPFEVFKQVIDKELAGEIP
jgi:protein-disulfide isomerase